MSTIDEILRLLKDGKWHNSKEIIENCPLSQAKTKMLVNFLREYNLIQMDENERKIKLHPVMLNFMNKIQRVEMEEALSHEGFEGAVGFKEFASLRRSFEKG